MKLGQFIQDRDGSFHGKVAAYGLPETSVVFIPQTSQDGKAYYAITADPLKGAFDGGAAFPKEKGNLFYLAVMLDSPMFPAPVNAALFQDRTNAQVYHLVWDRPAPKAALTAENRASVSTSQAQSQQPPQSFPQQKRSFFHRSPGVTP